MGDDGAEYAPRGALSAPGYAAPAWPAAGWDRSSVAARRSADMATSLLAFRKVDPGAVVAEHAEKQEDSLCRCGCHVCAAGESKLGNVPRITACDNVNPEVDSVSRTSQRIAVALFGS